MLSLDTVAVLLQQHEYAFLFVISIIEGPITDVIAAFLAAKGFLNIFVVYWVVVAGDLAGDVLFYCAGRLGRIKKIEKFARFLGVRAGTFKKLETYFEYHGYKAILVAKFTQTGGLVLPAAGMAKMPIGPFFWYNLLGALPKALFFVVIGYYFGYAYKQINSVLTQASLVCFAVAFAIFGYWYYQSRNKLERRASRWSKN